MLWRAQADAKRESMEPMSMAKSRLAEKRAVGLFTSPAAEKSLCVAGGVCGSGLLSEG